MERELVYKNLEIIKEAVLHHQEILIDIDDQNKLTVVSPQIWEKADFRLKERSRFMISKTISFCPSVFEENANLRDTLFTLSADLVKYFNQRGMGELAELLYELIHNEMEKDGSHHDYTSDQTGT